MSFPKAATLLLAFLAASIAFSTAPQKAAARDLFTKTYQVQVEYWFFDTDYYFWSTVFESSNLNEAMLMYELLLVAQENGQLNEVVGASYGRYIAVDVRMITVYHLPEFQQPAYADLQPINGAKLIK